MDDMTITEAIYREWYQQSIQDPETFWAKQARKFITWFEEWEKVFHGSFDQLDMHWFTGAKLNVAYNCLDRHLEKEGERVAILWEGDDPSQSRSITYRELHEEVCRLANALKALNVKKGDRVCIYLPMIPEAAVAMLACARIGAVHSVVFGGFSAEALKLRIQDADCHVVITANEGKRGNKTIPLKQQVNEAMVGDTPVQHVIVVKHTNHTETFNPACDVWYHEIVSKAKADCPATIMDAEDPLFILYTSGSTGKPKGILHGTGGYLLYAAMTFRYVFDYRKDDIFWCTADVGWITGHSYCVYGPLANGATVVMFEGVPNYPDFSRFWQVIDKYRVTIFYTAPTAIRALRREGDEWVKATRRDSLRLLGTVGEPINAEACRWYYTVVGDSRCPVVDTWWQTETGGIMISPLPFATPFKPGAAAWPFFGIVPAILDTDGEPVPAGTMGKLVITQPWPGMMQTVYGNTERFIKGYFSEYPGKYLTGDQAKQDEDGYYWIAGRSDDIIKISGHRVGTQEVESALIQHLSVSEAAVVGVADAIKGQGIYAFVHLKIGIKGTEELKLELIDVVRKVIGPIALPDKIQWVEGLPKTRSGKIMRRLLRKIADLDYDELGDLSTLADPSVIEELIATRKQMEKPDEK
jgi:acetyl-CoA synthetase